MLLQEWMKKNRSDDQWNLTCQSKSETLRGIMWKGRIQVNITYSYANKAIWSAMLVGHLVNPLKWDLLDFASDSVISKVTLSTLGHVRGQWILTSFTHGCRPVQCHNGGLPVVFSNMSTSADRTLSRRKMDDRSSWPLIASRVTSLAPSNCMTKEASPWCSSPHLHLH